MDGEPLLDVLIQQRLDEDMEAEAGWRERGRETKRQREAEGEGGRGGNSCRHSTVKIH